MLLYGDIIRKKLFELSAIEEQIIKVAGKVYDKTKQTTVAPSFNHPIINQLYKHDFSIEQTLITEILALSRPTLIQDLETLLKDCIYRYEFFKAELEENYEEDRYYMAHHALSFLAELKAIESLPTVFYFLEQGPDLISFWLGRFYGDGISDYLFNIIDDDLALLTDFMTQPDINTSAKLGVVNTGIIFGQKYPEKRKQLAEWYSTIMRFYIDNKADAAIFDEVIVDALIDGAGVTKVATIKEQVARLYELEMVNVDFVGTYEQFEKRMEEEDDEAIRKTYNDIYERYIKEYELIEETKNANLEEFFNDFGLSLNNDDDDEIYLPPYNNVYEEHRSPYAPDDEYDRYSHQTVKREGPKIGRNDPCSCGSGKKYKKCCLKK